tara:strand:+ start:92 stop:451 length:360 start_codon:yes stop_codon:yes gene_type:complete
MTAERKIINGLSDEDLLMPYLSQKLSFLLASLCLAGCVTSRTDINDMRGSNQPVEYRQGFVEGCDSGYNAAGSNSYFYRKDIDRYLNDKLYQKGWLDGLDKCRKSYDNSIWSFFTGQKY